MRSRVYEESSQESVIRERELRELQVDLERCRIERDEWEREALESRVSIDEAKTAAENYKRDLEIEREAREREHAELEAEREKTVNLQSVLEDFQNGTLLVQISSDSRFKLYTVQPRIMNCAKRSEIETRSWHKLPNHWLSISIGRIRQRYESDILVAPLF